jgi:hypothetical protein
MSNTPWLWEVTNRQAQLYRTMPEWNPGPMYGDQLVLGIKAKYARSQGFMARSKNYKSVDQALMEPVMFTPELERVAEPEKTRMERDLTPDETGSAGAANDITVQVEPESSGTRTKIMILAAGAAALANFAGLI